MIAIASLLIVLTLSLLVTRVATVILVATGMSRQAARFQARSAFTGSGFTTQESEQMVAHPLRRRVAMTLMLLGHAGVVAAAGTLIIGFRNGSGQWRSIVELLVGLTALLLVSRSQWVDRRLTRLIRRLLARHTDIPTRDVATLLDLTGHYSVSELMVEADDWIASRPLAELGLRDEGIAVLGISRKDGGHVGVPTGGTVIRPDDTVIVYGRTEALDELDRRPAGVVGDRRHAEAVDAHRWAVIHERSSDLARGDGVSAAGP
ncbi:MAG TPA: TrkA C-terminal domain-containing protein [Acidimicrobiales bacterium]|nr:TrkA C-terminal domain-containing protein [Acidimicrobiales bacterium]